MEIQEFVTLLSMLATAVHLNFAFHSHPCVCDWSCVSRQDIFTLPKWFCVTISEPQKDMRFEQTVSLSVTQ